MTATRTMRTETLTTAELDAVPLSKPYPGELAPVDSPFTLPPPGALVFKQHVHRHPEPIGLVERTRIWYMGVFWEVLEPVRWRSAFSCPALAEDGRRRWIARR